MSVEREILRAGNGETIGDWTECQWVTVHYTLVVTNPGELPQRIYSTRDPGQQPFEHNLGLYGDPSRGYIDGWMIGLEGIQVGELAQVTILHDAANGLSGFFAWGIEPDAILEFEVEVLQVENTDESA